MKKLAFFIAGTKGGVGKSFFAMQLYGASKDLGLKTKVYDSDGENRTLCRFLGKEATYLDESNTDYPLDAVINNLAAEDNQITIVDMKAGTSRTTQEWFNSVPWEELSPDEYEFIIVFGCTCDHASVQTVEPWITYFKERKLSVHYLFVLNEKDGNVFNSFEAFLKTKKLTDYEVIRFAAVSDQYMTQLNEMGHSLRDYAHGVSKDCFQTLMERSRIRRYYYGFTSPLVCYISRYFGKEDLTEERQKLLSKSQNKIIQ